MSSMVLAMDWLMVAVGEDGDASLGLARFQVRLLYSRLAMRWAPVPVIVGLQECTSTLSSMRTAASLFLFDGSEVMWVLLFMVIVTVASSLCLLFSLAEVYALLLGVVRLVGLAAVAFDMGRPLLALLATVLALRDRSTLLRDKNKLAVKMGTSANTMALQA